ncbi:MAG: creatininase family protein [Deltaproteobacteria bacterium]|nr:creatininase family protein [Deltaproteobacteria bacterium]
MYTELLPYEKLTQSALLALPREQAAVFWTVSPIEVHGPHLPLGTDIRVGDEVMRRTAKLWLAKYPNRPALMLPALCLGADTLRLPGSLQVSGELIVDAIVQVGTALHGIGFRTLVIGSNHGGPRHLIALEKARRILTKEKGMVVVNPFGAFMNAMTVRDPEVLGFAGMDPASPLGGNDDVHAGTFETSLALALFAEDVDPSYRKLPKVVVPRTGRVAGLMRAAAQRLRRRQKHGGHSRTALGLENAAGLLEWLAMKPTPGYVGEPPLADATVGDRALTGMATHALDLLEHTLAGDAPEKASEPFLWDARIIARLPL